MRFIVTFCTWREEGAEEDADEFNEAFLDFCSTCTPPRTRGFGFERVKSSLGC